jgi:hypothetical protein
MAEKKPGNKSFEQQLSEMPVEYLICMDLGHGWDPTTLEIAYGDFELGLLCMRCAMERDRWRGADGRLRNRYWHHKGDYGFRGCGRLTAEMREVIRETWQTVMEAKLPKKG